VIELVEIRSSEAEISLVEQASSLVE